ncbi:Fc.00g042830.m01.CDS01 [Cosmosporella sp. VM-42]
MGSTTILRGFKVSVAALDEFLMANGVEETLGAAPFYSHHPDKCPISILLHKKITEAGGTADRNNFRVIIPSREGTDLSTVAYVTYTWVQMYAQLELHLDEDLPVAIPAGFEALKTDILSYCDKIPREDKIKDEGKMGLFAVYTHGIRGHYVPQIYYERAKVSLTLTFGHPTASYLNPGHF